MNSIIEWMRENHSGWRWRNGWYMCVPMTVVADAFGMTLDELGEQTWYWKGDEQ